MCIQSAAFLVRLTVLLAVGLVMALDAPAEPPARQFLQFGDQSPLAQVGVVLPSPSREYKQALSRAQRSIDDGEFSDAIDALVEILGRPDAEDSFIDTESGGTMRSLKSAARELLGSLPKAGRDIYELQYGVEARQLLEQAVAARDIEKLTDVSRRFFHTQAGYDASFLLGQYLFDRRRPLSAAITLARLMDRPVAINRYGPELSLLLAMSWQLAAHPENARETLLELKRRDPNATVRIGENEIPLFGNDVDPLVWLSQIVGNQPDEAMNYVHQWALFRGGASRNSATDGGMPLPGIQWRVDVCPESVEDEAQVRRIWKQNVDQELPLIPALHPLAVGDYVLMRTIDGIFGVDVETGKRVWPFPWYQEDESLVTFATGPNQLGATSQELVKRQQRLQQRIWHDVPQGQLSSDGQLVFAVHGTESDRRVTERFHAFGARPFVNLPMLSIPGNQLVALELATQGKIRWLLGGEDGDLPELRDVFFMGPPLPLSGRLYVVVEVKDEIKLLVLDAEKGTVLWSQQLAHLESSRQMSGSGVRRMAGASPSFGDGILVCPTSAGAAVAVDLATRSLAWGYKYAPTIVSRRVPGNVVYPTGRSSPGSSWADGSVTIEDGRVLLTPVEANSLICLDLLTGKPAWKAMPRGDAVYVAGVEQGVIVLVGKHQVRGIRLSDGSHAWEKPLTIPGGAMPSGRGFISSGAYFLPTTADQIVRFRIVDGMIVEVIDSEYPLGNLICHKDKIMSQTPDALYAFYLRERVRELIPQRLAENPNDPRTLENYARLLIDDGEWEQAAMHLRRALELYSPDSSHRNGAKSLLVNVLLSQMRQNFDQARLYREELEQSIVDPQQRVELYRVLATGLEERNQIVDAFDAYLDLARLEPGQLAADVDDISDLERCEENRRVRRGHWLRSQIHDLWSAADVSQREQMTVRVTELANEVRQSAGGNARTRFVESFFEFPQAQTMIPELAREAVAAEYLLSAERWLTLLQQSPDPQRAATATANLAELYKSRHRYEEVYDQLVRLQSQWPDQMIDDNLSGRDLAGRGMEELRAGAEPGVDENGPGQLDRWPTGRVTSSTTIPPREIPTSDRLAIDLREVSGQWNDEYRLFFDRGQRYEIVLLDSHGTDRISIPCKGRRRTSFFSRHHNVIHAKAYGSLLIVSLGYEIVAVDLIGDVRRSQDRVLWRVELLPSEITSPFLASKMTSVHNPWTIERSVPTDKQGRRVGILGPVHATGVCYQKNTELRCVDPLSGHINWMVRGFPPGCDLFGDEQRVFVVPPNSEKAMVLAMSDGRNLGERPVPQDDRRWTTQGGKILTWDGKHGRSESLTLRIFDVWEGTNVWSREYADLSRGFLLGVDELVVLQPDGKLELLDLVSGELQLMAKLLPEPQLSQVYAMRSRDQYLFATNQPITQGDANRRGLNNSQSGNVVSPGPVRQVNGRVYAFDRITKSPMWPVPAEIDDYSLPLGQAVNSPALTFVRYIRKQEKKNNRTTTQQYTELLCLDRRDGRLLARADAISRFQPLQRIEADPAGKRVIIELRSRKGLVLNFSDEPRPPAVPLQSRIRRISAPGGQAVADKGLSGVPPVLPKAIPQQLGLTDLATQIIEDPFK